MISESLLLQSLRGNSVTPLFLGPEDIPWLERLIEEFARFEQRPYHELKDHLKQPLAFSAPPVKRELACLTIMKVLRQSETHTSKNIIKARLARAALFKASHHYQNKEKAMSEVATRFEILPELLLKVLFSDLKAERLVKTNALAELDSHQLALLANLNLVKALLARSKGVKIEIFGQCRPVIRQAKLKGLICIVETAAMAKGFRLIVSGPFSIFHHTLIYGRHLGELLPFLQLCHQFKLEANCWIKGKERILRLSSGAPLPPANQSKKFDSLLEQKFFREFTKLTLDWDLIREPEPIVAGSSWIFPDFELRHRHYPERRWLVEIVGFWHPDYLAQKFNKLKASNLLNFIICIDRKYACGQSADWHSTGAQIFEYSRSIDVKILLKFISSTEDFKMTTYLK